MQGYDIWDRVRKQVSPEGEEMPPLEADPQYRAMNNQPPWVDQATAPYRQPRPMPGNGRPRQPQAPYETGDPQTDEWLRQQNTTGPDQDDPFADQQSDPAAAKRLLNGAYQAGLTGDDQTFQELAQGPYAQTPFGKLLMRAYNEGRQQRGQRR